MQTRRFACFAAALMVAALVTATTPVAAKPTVSHRVKVKQAAARLDAALNQALREAGVKPAGLADDAAWARRTHLAIVGRIPTEAEIAQYKNNKSTDRGLDLVDALLDSRGYDSHMFNWWADLLRARSRLPRRISGEPYIHWIKDSIENDKPYDEMVKEMLVATGPVHQRDNGATGYLMRDRNMPEDNMSNTIRLFLGSRLECAQCHNHPFDKWSQRDYFEMVAFTGGLRYQKNPRQDPRVRELVGQAQQKFGRNGVRAVRRLYQAVSDGIYGTGTGAARLPKDYQYDDAKPLSWVHADSLFAPSVKLSAQLPNEERFRKRVRDPKKLKRILSRLRPREQDSRETLATWMTSVRNERFATVVANRMWKRAFGRGLIEPIDDIRDDTEAVIPELMTALRGLMIEVDFDLKEFQRTLYYSRHWRRAAVVAAQTPGTVADQRGPLLRRMTAEQVWDSLLTLVVNDLDSTLDPALNNRTEEVYARFDELSSGSDDDIMERTERLVLRYTKPEQFRQEMRRERQKRNAEMRAKRVAARPLLRELRIAQRDNDQEAVERITAEFQRRGIPLPGSRAGRALRDLQRASDLPSPAPGGHLLSELGQSDRDLIEAGHTDPTVPQVLALLNAFIEQRLLTNRNALLTKHLGDAKTPSAAVRTAFWSVLNRAPTGEELSTWKRDISKAKNRAVQDLVWTLVNTHEFLFIQ